MKTIPTSADATLSADLLEAARLHRDLLAEQAAAIQAKLALARSDYARDSLADLLDGVMELRRSHEVLLAAAGPALALAA